MSSQNIKFFLFNAAFTIIVVVLAVFLITRSQNTQKQASPSPTPAGQNQTASPEVKGEKIDNSIIVSSDSHTLGPKDAKVVVVEFSDFQCPACAYAHPIFNQAITEYKSKVLFVFRNFPLSMHPNALPAAIAAEAAGLQGKFWEMNDKLFENQKDWSTLTNTQDKFAEYAKSINLDVAKFKTDLKSEDLKAKVEKDMADGENAKVAATPTFFVNGERIEGAPSYPQFKEKIDALLGQ